jgi:hypothetical protein
VAAGLNLECIHGFEPLTNLADGLRSAHFAPDHSGDGVDAAEKCRFAKREKIERLLQECRA